MNVYTLYLLKLPSTSRVKDSFSFRIHLSEQCFEKSATNLSNGSGLILKIYKRIMNVFT
jgi:hypothetical protein